jgi:hypothetical protein
VHGRQFELPAVGLGLRVGLVEAALLGLLLKNAIAAFSSSSSEPPAAKSKSSTEKGWRPEVAMLVAKRQKVAPKRDGR